MKRLVEETLRIASSQLGALEEGGNRGPRVSACLLSAGAMPGNPWCAAFVYRCTRQGAGGAEKTPFVRTAYGPTGAARVDGIENAYDR